MPELTIGGQTFKVSVEGDASRPAVLLSNALGADMTMWDGQMAELTKYFRVIRYDPRGHGGSHGDGEPASIARLGLDALAILDALEISKAHWLGLSMGGAVGLWVLAHAPDRIDRAVLANTAPRLGTPESWNARITAVLADGMADTAAATVERWFGRDFRARAPARVAAIQDVLRQTSPRGYAACCAALRDMDLRGSLSGLNHEILVVSGREDPVVPDAALADFVASTPTARHVSLDARHLSNVEAEADFNAVVVKFLTAKAAARRAKSAPAKRLKSAPRKASAAKATPTKRGSATRRSNAARSPLKKTVGKRVVTKATAPKPPKKKPAAPHRRPATKKAASRRTPPDVVVKKIVAKASRKKAVSKAAARRPTPTTRARVAVKTVPRKAKAPRKVAAKGATKKPASKSVTKTLPATRRKSVTKARRPTGRRKT
jgi:3-oxoadipate enol-lactonase